MSNTILNIMIFGWHFQVIRDRPWLSFAYNDYHAANGWPDGRFAIY